MKLGDSENKSCMRVTPDPSSLERCVWLARLTTVATPLLTPAALQHLGVRVMTLCLGRPALVREVAGLPTVPARFLFGLGLASDFAATHNYGLVAQST